MIEIRSLRDLLRLFFIFRREFLWAVGVTAVVAVLGAFLLPTKFESTARLLVKPGLENSTLPIEAADRQTLISPSTQRDPVVDEEKMLTGRTIVHLVAQRYLDEIPSYQPQGFWQVIKYSLKEAAGAVFDLLRRTLQLLGIVEEQSAVERLATKLEKNFSVSHEAGSAVMELSFTWDNPTVAQKVMQTWVSIYLEERLHALERKSLYTFYESEAGKVAEQINGLKKQLQVQLVKINGISAKERLENLTNQINRMTDARSGALSDLAGARSFLNSAREQLKRLPAESITDRLISLNPNQLDLKLKLNGLNLDRTRLLSTYREDAPPVRDLEANISAIQALINAEAERIERSRNVAPNAIVSNLRQQILDTELHEQQLNGQLSNYEKHLKQMQQERSQVLTDEPQVSQLQMQLQSAEQSFALYANSQEKARINRELDNSQISNIAQIEHATFNPSRTFPKSLLIIFLALPAGFAVGLLTLYLCYLLDQRIHDGDQIESTFKVPLWTTLLDVDDSAEQAASPFFMASIYRIYGLLPIEQVEQRGLSLGLTSARPGEGVSFITEKLQTLLQERGYRVRLGGDAPASPGEIVLIDASALLSNQEAFIKLRRADLIALVIEARQSTVPMVEHALSILTIAHKTVNGIILNRRRFEIPESLLKRFARWRSVI
ncbi:MAG: lipopolysaccharide biosynthesis protein [Pseudomonadales bacterium RIFCSPLOWO2_12_59_9]|nr:MAG: lipopolysaccharide biosynthesis protein [Pseudomonadales bacterium RIFCSPLOWO2_12_59_9]